MVFGRQERRGSGWRGIYCIVAGALALGLIAGAPPATASTSGTSAAAAATNPVVDNFNLATNAKFAVNYVGDIAIQPDGRVLLVGLFGTDNPREIYRFTSSGALDKTFTVSEDLGWLTAIALQSDGRVIVTGRLNTGAGESRVVARLNADGSIDKTFSPPANTPNTFGEPYVVLVQTDGKVLLGGGGLDLTAGDQRRRQIARLNPDGSLDAGFNPWPEYGTFVEDLVLQPDGKILVAGFMPNGSYFVIRLNANGTVDSTFSAPRFWGSPEVLAIQPDGKVLVAGDFYRVDGVDRGRLVRLNADGSLDTSFSARVNAETNSIVVEASGAIVLAFSGPDQDRRLVVRLNPDGSVDSTWSLDVVGEGAYSGSVSKLALQSDGRLILVGNFTRVAGTARVGAARVYTPSASQPPVAVSTPLVTPITGIKAGTTLTGTAATWEVEAPTAYSLRWEACTVGSDGVLQGCTTRLEIGPSASPASASKYRVAKNDDGLAIRLVSIADNSAVVGGGRVEVESAWVSVGVARMGVPAAAVPKKAKGKWVFPSLRAAQTAFDTSALAGLLDIRVTGWPKAAVPAELRGSITNGAVFAVRVNGREVKAGDAIELSSGARAGVEILYYSSFEDRKTCPVSDADLAANRQIAKTGYLDFQSMVDFLDERKCPWAVTWSTQTSPLSVFTVQDLALEQTQDPDRPVQVRITARRPSTAAQLSVVVGAPPDSIVSQAPEQFTLGLAGAVYAFPSKTFTALWTSLMGDQARLPQKQARVQLFVNGRLTNTGQQSRDFSFDLATVFTEPGVARLVITTLNDNGSAAAQAYVDIPILDPATALLSDLVTWDGRCFDRAGAVSSCEGVAASPVAEQMKRQLVRVGVSSVAALPPLTALRTASSRVDARFVAFVANGRVPSAASAAASAAALRPRGSCAWWDLPCHIAGLVREVVTAVVRPKKTAAVPKPPIQQYRAAARSITVPDKGSIGAVTRGRLIGLDGASLIGLDGASIISDFSGGLIGLDGASLIGLDGASLIGLDGASLIGLDGASAKPGEVRIPTVSGNLIGLDGAS